LGRTTGASALELVGVVEDGGLGTLLRGVDPASGDVLRAPVRERTITVLTLDVESGEWHDEEKRLAPVSGYDLVFSCPKSVSLLHALTDDERLRHKSSKARPRYAQPSAGPRRAPPPHGVGAPAGGTRASGLWATGAASP
jgi:hypothetical protein